MATASAGSPIRTILFGYYASSCSWRVRAALYAKRVPVEERTVDIVKEKHNYTEEYRAVNPSQKVPALVIGLLNDTRCLVPIIQALLSLGLDDAV